MLCTRYWPTTASEAVTEPNLGQNKIRLHLHRVRRQRTEMAGSMPELRRLEHADRNRSRGGIDAPLQERRGGIEAAETGRGERARSAAPAHRSGRVRPRAGRRAGCRAGGADRRRSGHRQVDAAAAGARRDERAAPGASTSAARSRPSRSRCAPRGWGWTRAACSCSPKSISKKSRPCSPRRSRKSR